MDRDESGTYERGSSGPFLARYVFSVVLRGAFDWYLPVCKPYVYGLQWSESPAGAWDGQARSRILIESKVSPRHGKRSAGFRCDGRLVAG